MITATFFSNGYTTQEFTTGGSGYTLTSVKLALVEIAGTQPTFSVAIHGCLAQSMPRPI